jgi:hypothetical protein
LTPFPTSTPAPNLVPLLGNVYAGVKVYYALGDAKAYGFQIEGGSDSCHSMPSGRGVRVLYENGAEEWKDRDYLASSGLFFVIDSDPAISTLDWNVYANCP